MSEKRLLERTNRLCDDTTRKVANIAKKYLLDVIIFEYVGAEHTGGAEKPFFRTFGSLFIMRG